PVGRHVKTGGQVTGELLPAEVGDGEVDADAPQPCAGRRGGRVAVAGAVSADEGLLGQVLGRGRVEHDSADRAEDRMEFLVVQLAKLCLGIELFAVGHASSLTGAALRFAHRPTAIFARMASRDPTVKRWRGMVGLAIARGRSPTG